MRKSTHLKEEGFLLKKTAYRSEWESRVISFKSSGMGVTDWCKANDVKLDRFKYWLYKRKSSDSAPVDKKNKKWIAIETDPVASNIQEYALIVNVGQATIQVKPGFDPDLLSDVVKALAGAC
jgi:hypothetical protein